MQENLEKVKAFHTFTIKSKALILASYSPSW